MKLSNLPKLKGIRRKAKRVGRGYGSGKGGHTVGRGSKGSKARGKVKQGFAGGQLPLYQSLPHKRGFNRAFGDEAAILNLEKLSGWDPAVEVSPKNLLEKGVVDRIPKGGVKILGDGELRTKLTIRGVKLSESAKSKILKAGGKIEDA